MPKLLQINVTANSGSTGKIAEQIGGLAIDNCWESWIAYGRGVPKSRSELIRIGNDIDMRWHGIESRIFDNHGLASVKVTKHFIEQAKAINPDIIHLHNIHGYYINYPLLFEYLKAWGGPVVWTLHDCWPFTGHCAYFMMSGCEKWKTGCHDCGNIHAYPKSLFRNRSEHNFTQKKSVFTYLGRNLTLVPVSQYVNSYLNDSFFSDTNSIVIHNGIDLTKFQPCSRKRNLVLGVANVWEQRKGLFDFYRLRQELSTDYRILLIGLSKSQIKRLPDGIDGIERTESQEELAELYSSAVALVNPTYEDNYPTVNLEAIACGTPVITYRTGGSPESITPDIGIVVEQGDINGLVNGIKRASDGEFSVSACRAYAEANFNQKNCFKTYLDLYNSLIKQQS